MIVMDNLSGKTFLLYGLSDDREDLFISFKREKIKRNDLIISKEAELGDYTIDSYNNMLVRFLTVRAKMAETNEFWNLFLSEWTKLLPEKQPRLPLWKEFCSHLKTNPKNRLEKIYQGTTLVESYGVAARPHVALIKNNEINHFFDLHVMRGCKIGIDIARTNPNVSIYFSIDKLDMQSVLNKKQFNGAWNATSSELRYVYRHWQELKEKVHFFKGEEEMSAPWISGEYQKSWENYQPKSWNGVKRSLQETKVDVQKIFKEKQQEAEVDMKKKSLKSFKEIRRKLVAPIASDVSKKEQVYLRYQQLGR
ncbi:hypothetical protein [Candidatus Enterococcus wittei]|nr:hypothetical protein [Enterococcus sp. 10A9_DIV0425]